MSLKKASILLLLLFCAASLCAVPARHTSIMVEQPDGTQLTLSLRGDEHFHFVATTDGIPVVCHEGAYYYACWRGGAMESSGQLAHEVSLRTPDELALVATLEGVRAACTEHIQQVRARRSTSAKRSPEVPTSGDVRVPVLLVQYADSKFSMPDPQALFEQRIGGEGDVSKGTGSIRDYFVAQSEGLFRPQFDVIGPITLDKNIEYYGGNDKDGNDLRPREMISEACRKAFSTAGVDFSLYDNNKDGYVDIVYVIYAGFGEASYPDKLENTIWPHQWQLESPLSLGGVKVSRYACNNELKGHSGTELAGIGTFCHEFSHCLGLPDLYDTSSEGDAFGMDVWSVMDYGCYNNDGHTPCGYTAYEKDFLGWKPLVELRTPTQVTLKPLCEGGEAYKIVNDANTDEFYVVEYRDKVGWNAYAPASGMLVLHVDYLESAWHDNVVNNDPLRQRVTVIPADGKLTLLTLVGDVYPGLSGNTRLTADSHPAAEVYTGGYMNKDITNIVSDGSMVTFSFMESSLPTEGVAPHIGIRNDSIIIQASDSAAIFYTLDGSYPTIRSTRYTGPFVMHEKVTVSAVACREGHLDTPVARYSNWFAQGGATYRITSTDSPSVVVSESLAGNGDEDYRGHYAFADTVQHDAITYRLAGFDAGAFRHATALRSVTVESRTMQSVGDSLFHGCIALNAVVWDSPCTMPDEAFDEDSYRNLLVYLPDTATIPASLIRAAHTTLIRGGYCDELVLDATSAFYCPRSFTAGKATYRRTFKQTTGVGSSGGWEALVLPFDVEHISHSTKGAIIPFGVEGNQHCWVATPQDGAFAAATAIRANVPYIIAMPHHEAYGDYSLAGNITFSADEALIHPTVATRGTARGMAVQQDAEETTTVQFLLYPTYDPIEPSDDVYALNVGAKYRSFAPGSVFVTGRYATPPFSACLIALDDEAPVPYYHIATMFGSDVDDADTPTPSEAFSATSRGGYLQLRSSVARVVHLYDAVGRLVRPIRCEAGVTEVGPFAEGIYIIEQAKIYVER